MTTFYAFALAGLTAWALRAMLPALGSRISIPATIERWLGDARHAILAALIAGAVAEPSGGQVWFTLPPASLLAVTAGAVAASKVRSIPLTTLASLGTLWIATLVLG